LIVDASGLERVDADLDLIIARRECDAVPASLKAACVRDVKLHYF
jgi:hypothetical protein